jgi:hypothetical protein
LCNRAQSCFTKMSASCHLVRYHENVATPPKANEE